MKELKNSLNNAIGSENMSSPVVKTLLNRLESAEKALEFYAATNTWSPDNFMTGSEKMRSDLSETKWSRFTPGAQAREHFKKYPA
jgi:hypothetical protein